jgi:alanine racemase
MLRKQVKKLLNYVSDNRFEPLNFVELSRENTLSNVGLIQKQHPSFGIIPVLKANAYGHGLIEMATILNGADCRFLAVDGYFEASKIRDISKHHILVLGYINPVNVKLLDVVKCSFVVQDIQGLEAFGKLGKPVRIHAEINTGMNRLGLSADELPLYLKTLKKFPNLKLEGIMTHLADADNPTDNSFTLAQVKKFDQIVDMIKEKGFNPAIVHIAQTAGSTKATSKYANAIRLGIGLYGINPLREADKHFKDLQDLKPVMEIKSTIIKVINLEKGDRVSYNGIFTAPRAMRIGVLPLGYYEGIPRELSNKGSLSFQKLDLPIVGRVCMNHTMVELTSPNLKLGDVVTVVSRDQTRLNSVDKICRKFDLFNYLFVTKISSSIKRKIN